jgi:hypothetical protein
MTCAAAFTNSASLSSLSKILRPIHRPSHQSAKFAALCHRHFLGPFLNLSTELSLGAK